MNFVFFALSLFFTLRFIWNGHDHYDPKDWGKLILKLIMAIALMIIFGLALKFMIASGLKMSIKTAKELTGLVGVSLLFIVGMKIVQVGLCSLFKGLVGFHTKYNTVKNREMISQVSSHTGPILLILSKILISLGSVLIFYGIWFGSR